MTDIALIWDAERFSADLALDGGGLVTDDGLRTAVIISLFTDARARDDDVLPDAGSDRRGWWGDVAADPEGDETGARLWLLGRAKNIPETLALARDATREALAWLIEDRVARAIDVEVSAIPGGVLTLAIGGTIHRPDGRSVRFDHIWEATA